MRLRARLALMALLLMLVPTITLSIISIDSGIGDMIDDMSRSTDFMIAQIFEEVRLALSQGDADVATALRNSQPVRKLLDSTVAFGPGVVAASIVANDGTVIVAANGDGEGKNGQQGPQHGEKARQSAAVWAAFILNASFIP